MGATSENVGLVMRCSEMYVTLLATVHTCRFPLQTTLTIQLHPDPANAAPVAAPVDVSRLIG